MTQAIRVTKDVEIDGVTLTLTKTERRVNGHRDFLYEVRRDGKKLGTLTIYKARVFIIVYTEGAVTRYMAEIERTGEVHFCKSWQDALRKISQT